MTAAVLRVSRWAAQFQGRRLPCAIGRGGVRRDKREGDGATPLALLRIEGLLYRPDRMACPAPWARPIRPGDLWSDDPAAPDYNGAVRVPYAGSHEALRRADPLYDAVLLTDWNRHPALPGRGSAIFLHQWRRPRFPTEGCVAFGRADLAWLLPRLAPGARIDIRD